MLQAIKEDLYRWYGKNELSFVERVKANNIPQIRFMNMKRKVDYYRENNRALYLICSLIYKNYKIKYGVDMPAKLRIGKGVIIEHLGGITINPDVVIGNNICIYNGVTIGVEKRGKRVGCPVIGDEVWIGANSVVVGGIKVGNNVLIAPGSFVNFDVPDNSIVIGNPGKVIERMDATEGYIINLI